MIERIFIPFVATLMAIVLISMSLIRSDDPASRQPASSPPWTKATAENPTGSYRFTVNGWEDTVHWRIDGEETKVEFIDNIHPLIMMLLVVLVAFGLAILASDEESIKSLWPK
ncbi:hypothetical protein [Mariniblastus fucicola]|uniref:Uncharacterized protein n=1 Tax=Mariniblastus fucicola TaxID=980251 RepID=A0A5B9PAR8_9BACT|nr:hypothetical protein [Mariniblastus fucicola]QEG20183.1 hypothetical protein MFFC18_00300 [Mariniblastus fucicola]